MNISELKQKAIELYDALVILEQEQQEEGPTLCAQRLCIHTPGQTYFAGDVVHNGSDIYAALIDGELSEPGQEEGQWERISSGLHLWSSSSNYRPNQLVIHDNKIFRSLDDVAPNEQPGESPKWVIVLTGS